MKTSNFRRECGLFNLDFKISLMIIMIVGDMANLILNQIIIRAKDQIYNQY